MGGAALVRKAADDTFQLQNKNGDLLPLPFRYDMLSPISDPYDSKKDFIGYVDPTQGVVIVDAATLIDEFNRWQNAIAESLSSDGDGGSKVEDFQRSPSRSSLKVVNSDNADEGECNPIKHLDNDQQMRRTPHGKTMHQLAYEKKNDGLPLPENSARPISGFAIKQGRLVFNSTTFNAFDDEYHTSGRDMGDVERMELLVLLDKLNREEYKPKTVVVVTPMNCW